MHRRSAKILEEGRELLKEYRRGERLEDAKVRMLRLFEEFDSMLREHRKLEEEEFSKLVGR